MLNSFGGTLNFSTLELFEQIIKSSDASQLDEVFDWEEYNREVEELANASMEDAHVAQARLIQDTPEETLAITHISKIVENFLTVDGQPFVFAGREYVKGLYDLVKEYPSGCRNQIWHTGRQVEKSTTQAAKSISLGIAVPAYKTLYITPRFDQVTVFSQQRFKPMCEDSKKILGRWVKPSECLWQVGAKQFANGSFYNFRSCYLSADNSRGISANHLMIDEIQDILSENIPIVEQCQSHSSAELRFRTYAGTPKTNSNVITRRYQNSCQFEWLCKCEGCQHWNYLDENVIGPDFFECVRCHKEIFPSKGQWVPARPELLDKCWGFRIPQIMVPFKTHKDIKELRDDPQTSRRQFYNECLGLPYDEGELVLTEKDMVEACAAGDGNGMWTAGESYGLARRGIPVFAGIDYGTAEGNTPSFTVITIGYMNAYEKFQVIYMEKLLGEKANLAKQPHYLNNLMRSYGVRWVGADWGFGAPINQRLIEEFGWARANANHILMEFQYVKQKNKANWSSKATRYMLDRNQSMNDMIDAIRNKRITFFKYDEMRPYVLDFTTIFIEFDEYHGTMRYDHQLPDDCFHSVNYAYSAAKQYYGKLTPKALPDLKDEDHNEYDMM